MAKQYVNEVRVSTREEDEAAALALAERLGLPYVDIASFRIDPDLFRSIPVEWMLRYTFVPEKRTDKSMTIICADPTDVVKLDELELLTGLPLKIKVGSRAAIADILQKSESSQRVLDEATEEFRLQLVSEDEEGEETLTIDRITQDASPIIKLVDSIVFNAIQRRASDVHIETQENVVLIKYRIDGVLYQAMDPIDKRHHGTIISRIKVMSELDIAEKRIPQDGRFKLRVRGRTIDFRVSIMPTVHGEDAVIRILDKESANAEFKSLNLDVLGFDAETKKKLRKFIREPYGMVLVTGPTGSGKTTTLYGSLNNINSPDKKIITIEDPVEYQLFGVNQIHVKPQIGLTFANGLRSIVRQDPDVIMVGEIRDAETAEIAIQSALTGHRVFTTMHTDDAAGSIARLIDLGVEHFLVASTVVSAVNQRLVRRICTNCMEEYVPTRIE
ncbi:MAG TPA: GspE/PulE family protein, partial [Gemmatimonadaceae bacterium]|nr:GspE/PulE family protein [Gemmatimonadaceae bacterium]